MLDMTVNLFPLFVLAMIAYVAIVIYTLAAPPADAKIDWNQLQNMGYTGF